MPKRVYLLVMEKTTKNTVVYSEVNGDLGKHYFPKDQFRTEAKESYPVRLHLTLEWEE